MIKSDYIVFDCETGGLDETKNPITQYAAIILDGKTLKETDRWEAFIKPYGDLTIEQAALNSTMVTMSDINSGMDSKEFITTTIKFWESHRIKTRFKNMGRLVPVGHNVQFDIRFINWLLKYHNKPAYDEWMFPNAIDTWSLSKLTWGLKGDEKTNLGASCERAKIKLVDAHGAMNDTEATADLLRFYMKKLRNKKNSIEKVEDKIVKGSQFFEFKCGLK